MSWTAGYRGTRGHGRTAEKRDRTGALARLLEEIDQRAMALAADDSEQPAGDAEAAELGTAWRYFEQLAGQDGGECRAGVFVYWLAPSFDEQSAD
jgi:hypothetical protein